MPDFEKIQKQAKAIGMPLEKFLFRRLVLSEQARSLDKAKIEALEKKVRELEGSRQVA